jgi:hypothetical protein
MYSISVEVNDISVWSLDAHSNKHPEYLMTYPVRDLAVNGSFFAVGLIQLPAKLASTKHSRPVSVGWNCTPLSMVPVKHLPINIYSNITNVRYRILF